MKDIIKVSISRIAFVLDEDAFQMLDSYLNKLGANYRNNPDGSEIIADIEARIAEIILSKQNCDTVVRHELVQQIVEQLGAPEEMEGINAKTAEDGPLAVNQFPRRLYRDPEGAKLGGVCSGLGTFLNIDTIWIRIAFFAPLILLIATSTINISFLHAFLSTTFGALFFSYIILWFAIPMAKTPRQRLEMRGEKITASSIHNNFQADFSQITGKSQHGQKSASVLAELVYVLGRVLLFGVKALALLIGFVLALGAIFLLIALFAMLFASPNGTMVRLSEFLQINSMQTTTFIALLSLVVLAPLLILTYLLLRLVFNLPANRTILYIIFALWLALTAFVGYVAVDNFDNINHSIDKARGRTYTIDEKDNYTDSVEVVITEGIIEGDSTRIDSVVVKTSNSNTTVKQ